MKKGIEAGNRDEIDVEKIAHIYYYLFNVVVPSCLSYSSGEK